MRPLSVLVTGEPVEPVQRTRGSFVDLIASALGDTWPAGLEVLDARRGELPAPDGTAALVITGSAESVASRAPWILRAEARLRDLVAAGVPTLGICFGHQMLAQALGGRVEQNPYGREMGTVELELLAEDPLLARTPGRVSANMSHRDAATRLPADARVLARTERDPHAAVRFGPRVWGVQFHPEFDAGVMRGYIDARRTELQSEGIDPDALPAEDAPEAAALLRRFAELAR